jgi:hypothetical protein
MSINRFLDTADSLAELQAQLKEQESELGMEVLELGIFQAEGDPPLKNNFVNITSHIRNDLPDLQVVLVTPQVAADVDSFTAFYNSVLNGNTFVDSTMVLIADVEQQILAFRKGASLTPSPGIPQPGSNLAPVLPDYAQDLLSAAKGMPWSKSVGLPAMDGYIGMMPNRCRFFRNLKGPDGSTMNAVYYECKFDIDNDGSGGNAAHDRFHQSDTSLHDTNGTALDANRLNFAVLPIDGSQSRVKRPGLTDFGRDLGLHPGDVGCAMFRGASVGDVRSAFFVYGDEGPPNKIGEGSVHMANALGINSNPVSGGIDPNTMKHLNKGIIHIAFPGSGRAFLVAGHADRSELIPSQIDAHTKQYFDNLFNQPAVSDPLP